MKRRIVINGRFLTQSLTGVQRYARETLAAFDQVLAEDRGALADVRFQLAVPSGAAPFPLRCIETVERPMFSGHLWEQVTLPLFAGSDLLVGFSYSGPVTKRHQLITIHDATVAAEPTSFSDRYRWTHNGLIRVLRSRVATVMTVSDFSRDEIAARMGVSGNVLVGREGWEHSVAKGEAGAVLAKYGLRSGRYVLSVGSIKPNKNIGLIPAALRQLPDFPWTVAIVGARDTRVFGNSSESLPDSIRMLGFVDDADLGVLYQHAQWFLFPSLYEGFGLPAIEAMANGCPVLSSHAGSLPEVCGSAALYFDPKDAASLAAVLADVVARPELREIAISRHAERLERYSWRANAEILAAELMRLIGAPKQQVSA